MGETWATAFHPISSGISKLCPKIVNGREKLSLLREEERRGVWKKRN